MKEQYTAPEVEIIEFETVDVINVSEGSSGSEDQPIGGEDGE